MCWPHYEDEIDLRCCHHTGRVLYILSYLPFRWVFLCIDNYLIFLPSQHYHNCRALRRHTILSLHIGDQREASLAARDGVSGRKLRGLMLCSNTYLLSSKMRPKDDNEGCASDSARWATKETWKVGNDLLSELEKLREWKGQRYGEEDARTAKPYYGQNTSR